MRSSLALQLASRLHQCFRHNHVKFADDVVLNGVEILGLEFLSGLAEQIENAIHAPRRHPRGGHEMRIRRARNLRIRGSDNSAGRIEHLRQFVERNVPVPLEVVVSPGIGAAPHGVSAGKRRIRPAATCRAFSDRNSRGDDESDVSFNIRVNNILSGTGGIAQTFAKLIPIVRELNSEITVCQSARFCRRPFQRVAGAALRDITGPCRVTTTSRVSGGLPFTWMISLRICAGPIVPFTRYSSGFAGLNVSA